MGVKDHCQHQHVFLRQSSMLQIKIDLVIQKYKLFNVKIDSCGPKITIRFISEREILRKNDQPQIANQICMQKSQQPNRPIEFLHFWGPDDLGSQPNFLCINYRPKRIHQGGHATSQTSIFSIIWNGWLHDSCEDDLHSILDRGGTKPPLWSSAAAVGSEPKQQKEKRTTKYRKAALTIIFVAEF